jgi:hypothetical protein
MTRKQDAECVKPKRLGTTVKRQNYMHTEIKSRLKLENACYFSTENLSSSTLLRTYVASKGDNRNIYRVLVGKPRRVR